MNVRGSLVALGLLAALVSLGELSAVWTCDCLPPPPPQKALAQSAAVFLAKVTRVEDDPAQPEGRRVTLQVERWWKGGNTAILTVSTAKSGAACGYNFQMNGRYLVYAYAEKGQKELRVSLCSRTRPAGQADKTDDFKELGAGQAPAAK